MNKKICFLVLLFLFFYFSTARAFTVTTFAVSSYNTNTAIMDTTLGLTGYLIEDFENTTLVSGLSIQYGTNTPITALPRVYDINAAINMSNGEQFPNGMANNNWDGTHALVNNVNNVFDFPFISSVSFLVANGTKSFGIGLANLQKSNASHDLLVNGIKIADITSPDLPNYTDGIVRNIYLRIDALANENIFSVNILATSTNEGIIYDHLAIANVPESSSLLLLGLALIFEIARRKS